MSGLDELFRLMEPRKARALAMTQRAKRMRALAIYMYERAKWMQEGTPASPDVTTSKKVVGVLCYYNLTSRRS